MNEPQGNTEPDQTLVGKTIAAADEDDDGHLHLRFTDGTEAEIEGSGYDGLWTSVYVYVTRSQGDTEPPGKLSYPAKAEPPQDIDPLDPLGLYDDGRGK